MERSQKSRVGNNSEPAKKEYRLGVLALLVAVGTGAFTYMQYRAAEKAIKSAHDDSMRTMKLSSRPYIGVQPTVDLEKVNDPEPLATVTAHFTAMGSSPALDAVVQIGCTTSAFSQKQENGVNVIVPPEEIWSHLDTLVSHSVLFPQSSVDFHCAAHWRGKAPGLIFVVGEVRYLDVFKDPHKTRFCFFTGTYQPFERTRSMLPCSSGNTME